MIEPERRERPRHACDLKVEVFLPDAGAGRHLGEGTLIDISLGGGLLAFPGPLWQGIPYVLRLTRPVVAVLPCRVQRGAGVSGENSTLRYFGLVFDLSPEQEGAFAVMLEILADREPPEAGRGRSRS
ncbi:MAG: PilZ domain-containing protein [Elusimicrobia bacterium]|nr:PilZ domain-containing protein [Elusimicrobiota bacterium]